MSKDKKPAIEASVTTAKSKVVVRRSHKSTGQPVPANAAAPYMTTVRIGGRLYEERYYEPVHGYEKAATKNIIVIAFADDSRILGIKDKSRVDLLHGTRTWEDDTHEDAARREAREEGNVTLDERVFLAAVIETSPKDAPQEIIRTAAMTARIKAINPYQPWHDPPKRVLLTKEGLLQKFSASRAKDINELLKMAEFALADTDTDATMVVDHMRYIFENL